VKELKHEKDFKLF